MKKKELIDELKDLPDDVNIWIGIDAGEGWVKLQTAFVCNALDASIDGDEVSHDEIEYLPYGSPIDPSWEIDDYQPFDSDVRVGKPIIVVGTYDSKDEVDREHKHRKAD